MPAAAADAAQPLGLLPQRTAGVPGRACAAGRHQPRAPGALRPGSAWAPAPARVGWSLSPLSAPPAPAPVPGAGPDPRCAGGAPHLICVCAGFRPPTRQRWPAPWQRSTRRRAVGRPPRPAQSSQARHMLAALQHVPAPVCDRHRHAMPGVLRSQGAGPLTWSRPAHAPACSTTAASQHGKVCWGGPAGACRAVCVVQCHMVSSAQEPHHRRWARQDGRTRRSCRRAPTQPRLRRGSQAPTCSPSRSMAAAQYQVTPCTGTPVPHTSPCHHASTAAGCRNALTAPHGYRHGGQVPGHAGAAAWRRHRCTARRRALAGRRAGRRLLPRSCCASTRPIG